jgi:acetyl esterase/lipase
MRRKRSLLLVATLAAFCLIGSGHLSAEIVVEENLTYGKGGDTELKLDLARPQGEGPFPAIVFIHGGGWYQGGRQAYRTQIEQAAARGYVAATISYRLMQFDQENRETTTAAPIFPAQIHDAKAAVRWLRANAKKYTLDPERIGVWGSSAGGHLGALLGTSGDVEELEGSGGNLDQSSRVQAVVDWYGPTDFLKMGRSHDRPDAPEAQAMASMVVQVRILLATFTTLSSRRLVSAFV